VSDNDEGKEKGSENRADQTQKDKSKFDWVTERSACTLPKVFATLRQQVEGDVKTRNGLRPELAPYEFSMKEDINEFAVILKAKGAQKSVAFKLEDHAISVASGGADSDGKSVPMFQVTVTFNDKGECKLHANEQECEMWQVRRKALEELMFRDN
jgi:hypothetical protein